jgi:hypothetical protein
MSLDLTFGVLLLPAMLAFVLFMAAGYAVRERAGGSRAMTFAADGLTWIGIAFLAVVALGIVWNLGGWLLSGFFSH